MLGLSAQPLKHDLRLLCFELRLTDLEIVVDPGNDVPRKFFDC